MSRNALVTQKFIIHGAQTKIKGYLLMDQDEAGKLLSISVELSKEGSMLRAMVHGFTNAINIGLAGGIHLGKFLDEFRDYRFEPFGVVECSANVVECSSVIDYITQELSATFCEKAGDSWPL